MKFSTFLSKAINDIIYIPIYQLVYKKKYLKFNIAKIEETIDAVADKNISISRFGDGEFKWIHMTEQNSYEIESPKLSKRLLEVLNSTDPMVRICLPQAFRDPKILTATKYWEREMGKYGSKWSNDPNPEHYYLNTSVTRPYMDLIDKSVATYVFNRFKKHLQDKNVLMIEGDQTNFGKENDLLSNSRKITRLICPSKNAFENYNRILEDAKVRIYEKQIDIVLVALGPTATILAYDLTRLTGKQVLDVGHMDIEYSWYLNGDTKRVPVKGKAVNEVE
ncbi:GT-D fold domain-containing glycosyltransferase [Fructilactobacillus carniphilus]|uniref:GT-D fold domain-containing glycosyltransferase n=1 Tax=Fructilactobacillus carniphilus TaxID=2940297 RepID=A0ABY5BWJ1_9LACO|nr:GT-D fold domain-containing glycosyltransferase [Fructilactobacillus carniphilus]USS90338.1 GT-D fold domain-containing glycosyltransferase [Fructilactobacillus carniphilus]